MFFFYVKQTFTFHIHRKIYHILFLTNNLVGVLRLSKIYYHILPYCLRITANGIIFLFLFNIKVTYTHTSTMLGSFILGCLLKINIFV